MKDVKVTLDAHMDNSMPTSSTSPKRFFHPSSYVEEFVSLELSDVEMSIDSTADENEIYADLTRLDFGGDEDLSPEDMLRTRYVHHVNPLGIVHIDCATFFALWLNICDLCDRWTVRHEGVKSFLSISRSTSDVTEYYKWQAEGPSLYSFC